MKKTLAISLVVLLLGAFVYADNTTLNQTASNQTTQPTSGSNQTTNPSSVNETTNNSSSGSSTQPGNSNNQSSNQTVIQDPGNSTTTQNNTNSSNNQTVQPISNQTVQPNNTTTNSTQINNQTAPQNNTTSGNNTQPGNQTSGNMTNQTTNQTPSNETVIGSNQTNNTSKDSHKKDKKNPIEGVYNFSLGNNTNKTSHENTTNGNSTNITLTNTTRNNTTLVADIVEKKPSSTSSSSPSQATGSVASVTVEEPKEDLVVNETSITSVKPTQVVVNITKPTIESTILLSRPSGVLDAPGFTYQYIEIKTDKQASGDYKIDFKVLKSWMNKNYVTKESVYMYRYSNGKWNKLDTKIVQEDNNYVYYESVTPGFSYFAISGERKIVSSRIGMWVLIVMILVTAFTTYVYKKINHGFV